MHAKLHIITGAPGSGKTAILRGLRQDLRVVDEPAREVLAEQRSIDSEGTPESNPSLFVDLLLQRSIDNHEKAQEWGGSVLFDRGVPDCVAYARLLGTDPEPSIRATAAYRYNREVLVTWPWAEIYTTDDERKMTFDATVEFHRLLEAAYEQAGYTLLEVPRGSVEDRVAFVERFIS
jgi:predicted ATPase